MTRARRIALWIGLALVLGLVFAAYLQPQTALMLATQLWNCF